MPPVLNKPSARFLGLMYLCAIVIGALAVFLTKAYQSGFSGADEPSHFLNGYFVADYLSHHFGGNPMGAATEFYIHYPKISIGHWPPAYYGMLGLLFLVLPPTMPVAFAINVLFAALPAVGVAAALVVLGQRRAAAVAGVLAYALTPLAIEGDAMFMVDQPLAGCLVAATAVWIAYVHRPTWSKALGFALLAATAVLMKGNGWLVGLIPVFHIVLTANWKRLLSVKLTVAAALAAVLVVPWYVLTAKIAADGFNYHAGIDYAMKALGANLRTLVQNLTPVGALLALVGIAAEFRSRRNDPLRWSIVAGVISLPLATLVLQSVVPVDITERYMAPALPAVVVLAVLGATHLLAALRLTARPQAPVLGVTIVAVMAIPGIVHLSERIPKADAGLAQVTAQLAASRPVLTIIDGNAAYEGAFIANMAVRDKGLQGYVVRASKLLADSDFMGHAYTLKFKEPRQVAAELQRLGVQHIVIVRADNRSAYPHSEQMRDAVLLPDSGFRLGQRVPHQYRAGVTEVYDAVGSVVPAVAAVRNLGLPSKAISLTNTVTRQ
jgi:4-amino-4-deoxy-L-arabinose transferase-like glycosyltransferase